jgi:hypothetical protein
MSFMQGEADRLRSALLETPVGSKFDRLHAAQQAFAWASDPTVYKSPFDMIEGAIDNPVGSEDCPSLSNPDMS